MCDNRGGEKEGGASLVNVSIEYLCSAAKLSVYVKMCFRSIILTKAVPTAITMAAGKHEYTREYMRDMCHTTHNKKKRSPSVSLLYMPKISVPISVASSEQSFSN